MTELLQRLNVFLSGGEDDTPAPRDLMQEAVDTIEAQQKEMDRREFLIADHLRALMQLRQLIKKNPPHYEGAFSKMMGILTEVLDE